MYHLRQIVKLKRELIKLAELEDTRAVFKCGVYETLRLLADSVDQLQKEMDENETLLKAVVSNGFGAIRPESVKKEEGEEEEEEAGGGGGGRQRGGGVAGG